MLLLIARIGNALHCATHDCVHVQDDLIYGTLHSRHRLAFDIYLCTLCSSFALLIPYWSCSQAFAYQAAHTSSDAEYLKRCLVFVDRR